MREGMGSAAQQLHAAVDALLEVPLDSLADDELLGVVRDAEAAVRRLAAVERKFTGEMDRRGLAFAHGCADTATMLTRLLRLTRAEAKARVKAADRCGPRVAVSGETVEPLLPVVAAAQAAGSISARHAALIGDTIDALPAAVDEAGKVAGIETFLVEQARQFTPEELAKVTRRLVATLDPDGTLRDTDYRARRRGVTVMQRADGSVFGRFEGTAEFGELLLTTLDVLAAPKPADDGARDLSSAKQRNHDGLMDAMRLMIRPKQLPSANGVVATVILRMTAEQWASDQGLATTGHGALIPVTEAKQLGRGETRLAPVVFRGARTIDAYGSTHRLFTENQRLAMIARDGGCTVVGAERRASSLVHPRRRPTVERAERAITFPGCTVTALWCEADHVIPYARGGPTSVTSGHLACPQHHRDKDRNRWTVQMFDGLPHWTPPRWHDPTQTPRRNHADDPLGVG